MLRIAKPSTAASKVGETLTPGVRPLMDFLGLGFSSDQQGYLVTDGTLSAWGNDEAQFRSYLFGGMGQGWQIDRAQFDL